MQEDCDKETSFKLLHLEVGQLQDHVISRTFESAAMRNMGDEMIATDCQNLTRLFQYLEVIMLEIQTSSCKYC